jgi:hypothetical protein
MEQVPHIAMYCCQEASKEHLTQVVPEHLLPMVVKFLTDGNNQVRKTSQAALLVLLEQGLVERMDVKEQVCPVITKLTEADSQDDFRTEAVAVGPTQTHLYTRIQRNSCVENREEEETKAEFTVKDMGSEMFGKATHLTTLSSAARFAQQQLAQTHTTDHPSPSPSHVTSVLASNQLTASRPP